MKHTLFILALFTATIQTFAQSPRIKLNQITKDSLSGSVLISSPTDSGMVYSRDLFISYGADTVLILGGDTLAKTSGIISSVLSDGVTITGDGTTGNELTADTSVLATLRALSDSLALVISSVTADNVTITGDGTVGSPLEVDTATVIATKQDLDLYYLDSNPDGYTSNTGTVTSVAATAGTGISVSGSPITTSGTITITNTAPDQTVSIAGGGINAVSGTYPSFTVTGTEVDGDASNELQTLSYNSSTNEITLSDGGGTEDLSNLDLVDSTRINATGDTAYYYQNGVLIGTGAIAGGGGGTTYNNISETFDTVYISDYLDVDTSTLFVDAVNNTVNIGQVGDISKKLTTFSPTRIQFGINYSTGEAGLLLGSDVVFPDSVNSLTNNTLKAGAIAVPNYDLTKPPVGLLIASSNSGINNITFGDYSSYVNGPQKIQFRISPVWNIADNDFTAMLIDTLGRVGIGTETPSEKLHVSGNARITGAYNVTTGSAANVFVTTNGVLQRSTASSLRYKTNISDWNDSGLNLIMNLKPKTFQYKGEHYKQTDRVFLGLIAEEVEDVNNYLVDYNREDKLGEVENVRYANIVVPLIKAIQEQQAIIESIQSELDTKSSIIESQATEIEQLKSQIQLILSEIEQIKNN